MKPPITGQGDVGTIPGYISKTSKIKNIKYQKWFLMKNVSLNIDLNRYRINLEYCFISDVLQ